MKNKTQKKLTPYDIKKLGITFNNNPVVMLSYKGNFTKEEIINHAQSQSNMYLKKLGKAQIQIVLRLGDRWRTQGFTNVGEPVGFYDEADWYDDTPEPAPENYSAFKIYVQKM